MDWRLQERGNRFACGPKFVGNLHPLTIDRLGRDAGATYRDASGRLTRAVPDTSKSAGTGSCTQCRDAAARMAFDEPHRDPGKRGQEFRLEATDGKDWKTVVSGQTRGHGITVDFPTVTARHFRLVITAAKTSAELQLYRAH